MAKRRWVDLSSVGVYLGEIPAVGGGVHITLLDTQERADPKAVEAIGFKRFENQPRFEGGMYHLPAGQALKPSQLAQALGLEKCPVVDIEAAELASVFKAKCLEKFDANLNALVLRADRLGTNDQGQTVYQGATGRFIRMTPTQAVSETSLQGERLGAGSFMRAEGADLDLTRCADGLVRGLIEETSAYRTSMTAADMRRFAGLSLGHKASDDEVHRMQEAVEAAAVRALVNRADFSKAPGPVEFDLAQTLYSAVPAPKIRTGESIFLQQFSTPLPMSVVAQRLLYGRDDTRGKTVLEPTAGNGSLLSLMPEGARGYAIELDAARLAELKQNPAVRAIQGDAVDASFGQAFGVEGFDYSIMNPPFGSLETPVRFDKIKLVRRQDHFIALRALQARKDTGRSVVIFGADAAMSDGTVKGGSTNFLNYVHDHYDVKGVVELDGKRLYSRAGSTFNVRMLVVGDRLPVPRKANDVPEKLEIVSTYRDLWNWSGMVLESYDRRVEVGLQTEALVPKVAFVSEPDVARKLLDTELRPFLPGVERAALSTALRGPERDGIAATVLGMAKVIREMPVTYQTQDQGDSAVAHLHYFKGPIDAWITEKDIDGGVDQAFGLQCTDGVRENAGLGYISIRELVRIGAELDLHWTPVPLSELRARPEPKPDPEVVASQVRTADDTLAKFGRMMLDVGLEPVNRERRAWSGDFGGGHFIHADLMADGESVRVIREAAGSFADNWLVPALFSDETAGESPTKLETTLRDAVSAVGAAMAAEKPELAFPSVPDVGPAADSAVVAAATPTQAAQTPEQAGLVAAAFDSRPALIGWEDGQPLPADWTGVAKTDEGYMHIGREGGERRFMRLQARTADGLREEVRVLEKLDVDVSEVLRDPGLTFDHFHDFRRAPGESLEDAIRSRALTTVAVVTGLDPARFFEVALDRLSPLFGLDPDDMEVSNAYLERKGLAQAFAEKAEELIAAPSLDLGATADAEASPEAAVVAERVRRERASRAPAVELAAGDKGRVTKFGTVMRDAGLEMDGIDMRSWSVGLETGHEVHAIMSRDNEQIRVYRLAGDRTMSDWTGDYGAEAARQVKDAIRFAKLAAPVAEFGAAADQAAVAIAAAKAAVPPPEREANTFQVPYQSASRAPMAAAAMVPINMASSMYAALADLESRHGSVDAYVARKLQYSEELLLTGAYFDGAQIDGLALAIDRLENGRGAANADVTGFGKGRFMAGMMRYARLHDKVPVFLTIKPELFTDIFRDVSDIGSGDLFKRAFILNDGVRVLKFGTDEVLFKATGPEERKRAIAQRDVDGDVDVVLSTYSQFARTNCAKGQLLSQIVRDKAVLLLDESHVAAGQSNTGLVVGEAVANAGGVIYSSATPLKGVSSFSIYSRLFPKSVNLLTLPETLKKGGESLQEAISSNMARDGVFFRREHDFSKLTFETHLPSTERQAKNFEAANAFAYVLGRMSYMAGEVKKMVGEMNAGFNEEWKEIPEADRKGNRMQASSMNFGSRLYALNRQFLMGIKIEDAVEVALTDLQNGRKPVIAVENTGEALLNAVLAKRAGVSELDAELEEVESGPDALKPENLQRALRLRQVIAAAQREVRLDEPPQLREMLEIFVDRIARIKVQGRYGEVAYKAPESKEYWESDKALRKAIKRFPDVPLMPLDVITHELTKRGFPVAEVSGRGTSLKVVQDTPDGEAKWAPQYHPKADALSNVDGFQRGKYDAIIITRSGSTGISLHATDRFEDSDTRQRDFIVLQKAANIAEFLQWLGRVFRKDQVNTPIITTLESGLPAELRLTMMHNEKLRKLSANVTSNRDNGNAEDAADLLNDVGDAVALQWLQENPRIADQLDIDLPESATDETDFQNGAECPYVNKLMGRLAMVDVPMQRQILEVLGRRFAEKVEEMEQRGVNPFKVDVYEWGAKVRSTESLETGIIDSSGSTFDEPVKIVTMEFEEELKPVRSAALLAMMTRGLEAYAASGAVDKQGTTSQLRSGLMARSTEMLRAQLPEKLRNKDGRPRDLITADPKLVAANQVVARYDFLLANLPHFRPGARVGYTDILKGDLEGYVTQVDFPMGGDPQDAFLLGHYSMRVMFPGADQTKEISLSTLFNQGKNLSDLAHKSIDLRQMALPSIKRRVDQYLEAYDSAPDGKVVRTVATMQGNLFRAIEMAVKQRMGSPMLYTDAAGQRHRAVLLRAGMTAEHVKAMPLALPADALVRYIDEVVRKKRQGGTSIKFGDVEVFDAPLVARRPGEGVALKILNGGHEFRITMSGLRSRSGDLMTDGQIFDIGEKTAPDGMRLKLTGDKQVMAAEFDRQDLPQLLRLLNKAGHVWQFYVPHPDQEALAALRQGAELMREVKHEDPENARAEVEESTLSL